MFKETDKTIFVGRKQNGQIYGAWTSRPTEDVDHRGIEEMLADDPEVIAFQNRNAETLK